MKFSLLFLAFSLVTSTATIAKTNEIDDPVSSNIFTSNVLDDLSQDSSFNKEDYAGLDFGFVRFYEFAYSPTSKTYFNLISYFYMNPEKVRSASNPDGIYSTEILRMQMNLNGGSFNKYDLNVLSAQQGFYKVSLKDASPMWISSNSIRAYSISGLTVKQYKENSVSLQHEFSIASKYTYSGYAKSMNGNATSSLTCKEEAITVIDIKPEVGVWMSESSGGARVAIYYTYFNIPTNISDAYGDLYKIHYQYELIQLQTMYAMTQDLYDYYCANNDNWAVYVRYGHSMTDSQSVTFPQNPDADEWQWTPVNGYSAIRASSELVFITNTDRADVPYQNIETRYAEKGSSIALNSKEYDIITENVSQKIEIKENNLNAFERWWESNFHNVAYSDNTYNDINTWDIISSTTYSNKSLSDLSDELVCNATDLSNIKNNYLKSGQTTYLFRYENRPYYSEDIKGYVSSTNLSTPLADTFDFKNDKYDIRSDSILTYKSGTDVTGYYFDMYATVDFDIISFYFDKNGVITIIPVVMDPVSNFPSSIPGDEPETGIIKNLLNINWKLILCILGGILVLVIVLIVFVKVYPSLKLANSIKKSSNNSRSKRRKK